MEPRSAGKRGVHVARKRLSSLLDSLIEEQDVENDTSTADNHTVAGETSGRRSPAATTLVGARTSRKRRKRGGRRTAEEKSHIMYLFDRKIDLAEFDEDTPLYVLCRAWMRNRKRPPPTRYSGDDSGLESSLTLLPSASPSASTSSQEFVWRLPPPRDLIAPDLFDDSESSQTALSRPILDTSRLDEALKSSQSEDSPSTVSLLESNLATWRQLRHARRLQEQVQDLRHADSLRVLRRLKEE